MSNDDINNPTHYNTGDIECIDAIRATLSEEQYRGYLRGNVLKYVWRMDYKGRPREDAEKAKWYLSRLINEYMPAREFVRVPQTTTTTGPAYAPLSQKDCK